MSTQRHGFDPRPAPHLPSIAPPNARNRRRPHGGGLEILLVDDHALFRAGLRHIVDADPRCRVVAEAADGHSAVSLASLHAPDIVLIDLQLRDGMATYAVRKISQTLPQASVVVLTALGLPGSLTELLELGIRGYLCKNTIGPAELLSSVKSIVDDSSRVIVSMHSDTSNGTGRCRPSVTSRERDVLTLAAQAMSNAQIATRLSMTEATVKRHMRNLFHKLGAVSRLDAVNKARVVGVLGDALPPR